MLIRTDSLGPTGLGHLEIDQRAAGGRIFEADTYTCTHCNRVVVMNPERKRERYKCRGCNHHICDDCAAQRASGGPCRTMQQRYDEDMNSLAKGERQAQASPLILP
jgi:hypothetical protein